MVERWFLLSRCSKNTQPYCFYSQVDEVHAYTLTIDNGKHQVIHLNTSIDDDAI